ncbi:DUF6787 family protein [Hugenholtzia roseola]|uniref:DUF6787 family protein n=1 Tax=Hugenholtzia roseola TaxID=1002 RepID=UPI0003FE5D15|nr:DUF6787 family protein [Hugenholtzia roseola]
MDNPSPSWLQRLRQRWQVESNWQVLLILCVFALTGFSAMYLKIPIYAYLGVEATTPFWKRSLIWWLTVFPAYQVLLLGYGALLGQFRFFWQFEKRFFGRIGQGLVWLWQRFFGK